MKRNIVEARLKTKDVHSIFRKLQQRWERKKEGKSERILMQARESRG